MKTFTQLSYHERTQIYRGICDRESIRMIAKKLGRFAASTIWRETKRNSDQIGYLYAGKAQELSEKRKYKIKERTA